MSLSAGSRLGPYEVLAPIGAGGMGEVYRAKDTRLDRIVAIKVLPAHVSQDPERKARFEREAKTVASLNHPHICVLHDVGHQDGVDFLVMEYLEGETLAERVAKGPLPIDQALRFGTEIADALARAHREHIVHRDLKPANVLLTKAGAKLLDFGLAKADTPLHPAASMESHSPTATRGLTAEGTLLGTFQYMSPEQLEGKEADQRADIWAFGCVLYEMATGRRPFVGNSQASLISSIMTSEPQPIAQLQPMTPPSLDRLVKVCLAKEPGDRLQNAHDVMQALKWIAETPSGSQTVTGGGMIPVAVGRRRWRAGVVGLALLAGVILGVLLERRLLVPPVRPVVRFDIQLPRDAQLFPKVDPGIVGQAEGATGSTIAFAPDGSQIVYVGRAPAGQPATGSVTSTPSRLYVRRMDRPDPVPIPGTEGASLPFFSPDGQWLGFAQGDKLVKVALAGSPVTPIAKVLGVAYGATWTPGDTIIFGSDSGLMEVPAAGGSPRLIARPDVGEAFHFPEVLPDGRAVLFGITGGGSLKLAALIRRTGQVKRFQQQGGYPHYVTGGFVVLSDPSDIVSAVRFDAGRMEVTGAAGPLTDNLTPSPDGDVNLGVSRSGDFAFAVPPSERNRLVLVDRSGTAREVGADTGVHFNPRISPDGRRVALIRSSETTRNTGDLWVFDLTQHRPTRVTFETDPAAVGDPLWSPDGRRIAYTRYPQGFSGSVGHLYWAPADGSSSAESLLVRPGAWRATSFEPDGHGLVYYGSSSSPEKAEIWRLSPGGGAAPHQVLANGFENTRPSLSPDGRWFAYVSNESGRDEVYVRPYPGPGGRWQVSLDGGIQPLWSPTGREIFYRDGDRMMAAAVRTQAAFEVGNRVQLFTGGYGGVADNSRGYDVTRDGQTFLMLQPTVATPQAVVVTLNWFEELKRLVPGGR